MEAQPLSPPLIAALVLGPPLIVALAICGYSARAAHSLAPLWPALFGLAAGALAGAALGLALRVAMRGVALLAGQPTRFTVAGTLALLVAGALFGSAFGALYFAVRRWVPRFLVGKGIVFGVTLAIATSYPFHRVALADLAATTAPFLILLLTAATSSLWLGYGFVLESAARRLEYRWSGHAR